MKVYDFYKYVKKSEYNKINIILKLNVMTETKVTYKKYVPFVHFPKNDQNFRC